MPTRRSLGPEIQRDDWIFSLTTWGQRVHLSCVDLSNINFNKSMCKNIGKTSSGGGVPECMYPHMEMAVKYLCLIGLPGK